MIPENCGSLRTKVRVQYSKEIPGELNSTYIWIDIGSGADIDTPRYKYCLWVGVHGNEAFKLGLEVPTELATLTFRYDERINQDCRVVYKDKAYDIISVDHVRQRGQWTEIKVRRAAD